jgi:hypothetical protein
MRSLSAGTGFLARALLLDRAAGIAAQHTKSEERDVRHQRD